MFLEGAMRTQTTIISLIVFALYLPQAFGYSETEKKVIPEADKARIEQSFGRLPLYFIENQGQENKDVAYYVKGSDKTLYFTSKGVTFALPGKEGEERKRWAVKLEFVGANPNCRPRAEEKQEALFGYFKGKPKDWITGLATYKRIVYEELWSGIDLVYSGTVNQLKYEFVVKPGADPKRIRLTYRGADGVELGEGGGLVITTPVGEFEDASPYAYQEADGDRIEVQVAFSLDKKSGGAEGSYGFQVGPYDLEKNLILDPAMLIYCGYIGGLGGEGAASVAVDYEGSVYIAGTTTSNQASFPVQVGPDLTYNDFDYCDAFVAKINPEGTSLIYCGYIGGNHQDWGNDIAVDSLGYAFITGTTSSGVASFPVKGGPDITQNGARDAFVAKVSIYGTGLIYCGYIGGAEHDYGCSISVDGDGNAYVTGETNSDETSFPVLVGPVLTFKDGFSDAFVAKVNASGTALLYCGYIGGTDYDYGSCVAVDSEGAAYVSGYTASYQSSFPVKIGPDLTKNGMGDAFVAKVAADGTDFVYCGYIGGFNQDFGNGITVDAEGNA